MKRRSFLIVLALAFSLLITACAPKTNYLPKDPEDTSGEIVAVPENISADEASALLSTMGATFVDVRTEGDFETGHIPGAVSLQTEKIGDAPTYLLPVLDAHLVVYGDGSADAAEKLSTAGYKKISILEDFTGLATVAGITEPKTGYTNSFSSFLVNGTPADEDIFSDYDLTMINIWATYCSPCLNEMPDLGKLAAEYAPKGVQIVGLVTDIEMSDTGIYSAEDVALARELIELTGATYHHLLPSYTLYTALLSGISAVPTTVFVNSEGELVGQVYVGSKSGSEWAAIIEGLL